jgi:hypothetical protein
MKTKITLIAAFLGLLMLQSCTVREEVVTPIVPDNDTISAVKEVTVSFNNSNNYTRLIAFNRPIYNSDMVLVYHLYDVVNGNDVWRQMPQTYYIGATGELDYNFDFTKFDVNIFLGANFNLNTLSANWTQNQTFRIVIIPANFAGKVAIDYTNYYEVIKTFKLNDSIVKNR